MELSEEEEADIYSLEKRLRLYQELKGAEASLKEMWSVAPRMMAREFLMNTGPTFYPPPGVGSATLLMNFMKVLGELEKILIPVKKIKIEIINLKKKIEEVFARLTHEPIGFNTLHSRGSRRELIVLFLAILHLIRTELITVEQPDNFHEMTIVKNTKKL